MESTSTTLTHELYERLAKRTARLLSGLENTLAELSQARAQETNQMVRENLKDWMRGVSEAENLLRSGEAHDANRTIRGLDAAGQLPTELDMGCINTVCERAIVGDNLGRVSVCPDCRHSTVKHESNATTLSCGNPASQEATA